MRIILGLLGAFLLTTPVQAEKVFHRTVGTYDIACFNMEDEAFCSSLNHYHGLILHVVVSFDKRDGEVTLGIGLNSDNWRIVPGKDYKVSFKFNRGHSFNKKCYGVKITDDVIRVQCNGLFNFDIWDRLLADRWVAFYINGKPAGGRLSLKGSARGYGMQMRAFIGMMKGKPRETFDKEEFRNDLKEF